MLKKAFLDNQVVAPNEMKLSGNQWYVQQASRAVNQAVGRVIRHRHDYGAIILLDERFAYGQQKGSLSKWLQPHVHVVSSYGEAHGGLTGFFRRNKEQAATVAASTAAAAAATAKVKAMYAFKPPQPLATPSSSSATASAFNVSSKPSDVLASQVAIGDGQSYIPPEALHSISRPHMSPAPPKMAPLELLVQQTRTLMPPAQVTQLVMYMRDPKSHVDDIDALLAPYPTLREQIAPLLPPRSVAQAMDQLSHLTSTKRKAPSQPAAKVANPQCSICFDIVQTTSAPPCGHICCVRCWKKLQQPDHTITCPVCKGSFHLDTFTRVVATLSSKRPKPPSAK
ncbi:hypothetical protein H310_08213 [Aphanomyces invadans]|uniref:RING-type domain-containing protein n=1 Tax=Aphanomyces invadans TaxID=157072 RepID=A0A024TZX1_9STRA|nr:hypothetical protein H310_08213 [Aphanomyces invadans]ETV99553.1 hypothetical protein H310_08213 [Aphanomyces invadans]|eukprot:XP_008872109.1 hypothetical protein H310_08213 [Aphanomyces invadans]